MRKTKIKENHFDASNIENFDTEAGPSLVSELDNIRSFELIALGSVDSSSTSYSLLKNKVSQIVQNAAINKSIVVSYKYLIGKFHIRV